MIRRTRRTGSGTSCPLRVDVDARLRQPDDLAGDLDVAATGGLDVAHPLSVRAIGQSNDVPIAVLEDVDRRPELPSGLAPDVAHDREPGQAPGEEPDEPVRDKQVEAPDGLRDGHGSQFVCPAPDLPNAGGSVLLVRSADHFEP